MDHATVISRYAPVHRLVEHPSCKSEHDPVFEELQPAFSNAPYATRSQHRHDYYEIYLIDDGHGSCEVDGKLTSVDQGSVLVLPPGSIHAWDEKDGIDGFVVRSPIGAFNPRLDHVPSLGYKPWLGRFGGSQARHVFALAQWIADEEDDGLQNDRIQLFFRAINTVQNAYRNRPLVDIVAAFLQLVEKKQNLRWGVGDYAATLGVSRSTLLREVKHRLGKSPREVLQERQMLDACRLLEATTLTCARIADQLGYLDQAHFSRAFSRHFGYSPVSHRRKMTKA